jgi:hypothetical protein
LVIETTNLRFERTSFELPSLPANATGELGLLGARQEGMILDVLQIEREGALVHLVGPGAQSHVRCLSALLRHETACLPLTRIPDARRTSTKNRGTGYNTRS